MANQIQKNRLEEQIRFLYFKHRGIIHKIVTELQSRKEYEVTNIDTQYVQKVINRFKRERQRNWDLNICCNFMEYLHEGVRQRLAIYEEWLQELGGDRRVLVSVCHRVPVGTQTRGQDVRHICLHEKCGRECQAVELNEDGIYDLRMRILGEMRKDESHLLDAVKSLGFSVQLPAPVTNVQQFTYVAPQPQQKRKQIDSVSPEDKQLMQDIDDMNPQARERLINNLQKQIADPEETQTEFEKPNESETAR